MPAELRAPLDEAKYSVGETTFMRHPEQFAALEQAVPMLTASAEGRPLFVWSAGCASGEEAYSLAAALSGYPTGVRVLGTDVNPAAIEQARAGRYRAWSMRGADPAAVSRWLSLEAPFLTVRRDVRERVELSVLDLAEAPYPSGVDVIFCRNVLLYFRAAAAEAVLSRFHESLRPGGLLFLGYCDPRPPERCPFSEERVGSVSYFRKTSRVAPPAEASPAARPAPREPSREAERRRLEDALSAARSLCGQGAPREALELLAELHREIPLAIEPYVLAAMIADEAGLLEVTVDAARKAHFLAPDEPICQYLAGAFRARLGEAEQMERHLRRARAALDKVADLGLPLPYGEGITGAQLRRMIDVRLNGRP